MDRGPPGDPTPRLWGRLTVNPRAWFEPFGSGLVPALDRDPLVGAGARDPRRLRETCPDRSGVLPSTARRCGDLARRADREPGAHRARRSGGPCGRAAAGGDAGAGRLRVLQRRPRRVPPAADPGLDGARLVALLLPPQAREVYRNVDKYLPLFVLVALFVFSTLILGFLPPSQERSATRRRDSIVSSCSPSHGLSRTLQLRPGRHAALSSPASTGQQTVRRPPSRARAC